MILVCGFGMRANYVYSCVKKVKTFWVQEIDSCLFTPISIDIHRVGTPIFHTKSMGFLWSIFQSQCCRMKTMVAGHFSPSWWVVSWFYGDCLMIEPYHDSISPLNFWWVVNPNAQKCVVSLLRSGTSNFNLGIHKMAADEASDFLLISPGPVGIISLRIMVAFGVGIALDFEWLTSPVTKGY